MCIIGMSCILFVHTPRVVCESTEKVSIKSGSRSVHYKFRAFQFSSGSIDREIPIYVK
jgi:hypothetical protein